MNRWIRLAIAAMVNFPTGSAYIWALFQPEAIRHFGLSTAQANLPFAVFMGVFVGGNILGGYCQSRLGERATLFGSAAVLSLGFLATALVPQEYPVLLSFAYGTLGALGAGGMYNTVVATIPAWFPERKGLVTGILVCSVGASAFIMSPVCTVAIHAFGFSGAMLAVALIYGVVSFGGGFAIRKPRPEELPSQGDAPRAFAARRQFTAPEALRTLEFYRASLTMALALMPLFLVNPMVKSLGMARGLTESFAVATVMTAAVLNSAGRVLMPWLSASTGIRGILLGLFAAMACCSIGLMTAGGWVFAALVCVITFASGGFFALFPLVTLSLFGEKHLGLNYGLLMVGYGIASILCPLLTHVGVNFSFQMSAVASCLGCLLVWGGGTKKTALSEAGG